ncbi:hypothetical protein AA0113_g11800 [Alternaria arborescens]|uniref:T6SS Phospholipase effector Tle1-like catalytic domain-containing protein n=1 Tax=Alternaria arborescens TaxID=156630 RepID=A0A4Q4Q1T2_9PLEO|nr:hypothetical protein AA0113_g11800 [Alternaria arborescens]
MSHSVDETAKDCMHTPRKLVLCFDGTGNEFKGNTSDTNIVKLYDKFDRKDPMQYHYYQPGIGTYSADGGPINKNFIGNIKSKISKTIDSGYATTFDAHVIAGYRFIMRYYKEGDKIYMFGFSRGAFTARFLARMIHGLGLLSEGNEEMVPFAYDLYQQYEKGLLPDDQQQLKDPSQAMGSKKAAPTSEERQPLLPKDDETDEQQLKRHKLEAFTSTFCRLEGAANQRIKVHFLGLFDCVSSVAVLDSPIGEVPKAVSVLGTAHHVRHAVAVDEHRVKFKAALMHQDVKDAKASNEDIKEVWFPGNHGDVGGGWPAPQPEEPSWWRRYFTSDKDDKTSVRSRDPYQMSDVPLAWMIRELELLGTDDDKSAIKWNQKKNGFKKSFFDKNRIKEAYESPMHDTLTVGGGSSFFKVMLWKFMEILPFRRWELQWNEAKNAFGWVYTALPLNLASGRDIPKGALLHDSLLKRLAREKHLKAGRESKYLPCNNQGDKGKAKSPECLLNTKFDPVKKLEDRGVPKPKAGDPFEPAGIHNIYTIEGQVEFSGWEDELVRP